MGFTPKHWQDKEGKPTGKCCTGERRVNTFASATTKHFSLQYLRTGTLALESGIGGKRNTIRQQMGKPNRYKGFSEISYHILKLSVKLLFYDTVCQRVEILKTKLEIWAKEENSEKAPQYWPDQGFFLYLHFRPFFLISFVGDGCVGGRGEGVVAAVLKWWLTCLPSAVCEMNFVPVSHLILQINDTLYLSKLLLNVLDSCTSKLLPIYKRLWKLEKKMGYIPRSMSPLPEIFFHHCPQDLRVLPHFIVI